MRRWAAALILAIAGISVSNPFRAGGEALDPAHAGHPERATPVSNPFRAGGEALVSFVSSDDQPGYTFQTPSERAVRRWEALMNTEDPVKVNVSNPFRAGGEALGIRGAGARRSVWRFKPLQSGR